MIIEFDGIPIEIARKKIKNLHLRIYPPDGLIKISAPLKYSEQLILENLEAKKEWIHTQRERIRKLAVAEKCTFQTGSHIAFQGKHYLLIIKEHFGPIHINLHDNLMYCYSPPDSSPLQIQMILERWYKQQMQTLLPAMIQNWEPIIGVKVAQWGIRKMKTRWGSCNTRAARIWLNLNLMKKPSICLEYVLVHELIHLLEPSHNKRFYGLMDRFMPQWREYEFQLEGRKR